MVEDRLVYAASSFIGKTKGQFAANMSKKITNKNDQTNADGYRHKLTSYILYLSKNN